ncbi:MAG: alpha/beta fold hydrolase [Acidimicrobiia bacterium]
MTERVAYDEFSMFHENAAEFGLEHADPPTVRRERVEVAPGRSLSALVWGDPPPEIVLLHGGAQNAHTWDTVALALGRPLVAIDLAGHGHSDPILDGSALDLATSAADVATVIRRLAPDAQVVAGMSLGGLTTLALYAQAPDLVRRIVLVDVTPGVDGEKSKAIAAFVDGPAGFDSFDAILARTIEHNPTRTVASLRRGVLHNALQLEDGTWVWRHARGRGLHRDGEGQPFQGFAPLWDVVSTVTVPLMLARGMREQSVVDDADEAELLRRCPHARIEHFADAGHSLQGDTPVEFAAVLADFIGT